MPFKDPQKRYEAVLKSKAKKPELYKSLELACGRRRSMRGYFLQRTYGITLADFERMLEAQGGRCKICDAPPPNKSLKSRRLLVDHCHKTGKVRGLLCHKCNTAVGIVEQGDWVKKMEVYIAENS